MPPQQKKSLRQRLKESEQRNRQAVEYMTLIDAAMVQILMLAGREHEAQKRSLIPASVRKRRAMVNICELAAPFCREHDDAVPEAMQYARRHTKMKETPDASGD